MARQDASTTRMGCLHRMRDRRGKDVARETMMPVLNKKRDAIPAGARYVGRPMPFGNPFRLIADGTRDEVVDKYRAWFADRIRDPVFRHQVEGLRNATALVCFCAPLRCHADVIVEYLSENPPAVASSSA